MAKGMAQLLNGQLLICEFETQFLIILSFDLHTFKWILLQNIVQNDHFKL